ncbi:MAG: LLM class flavin-dependent oxidoreductase [Rhodospirillaceae bacterium]|nr:LLM class flavin-dependent oxidoreductase [Rhodospirillaceae bacterium]
MKFYMFHFMPYLHAPLDFRAKGRDTLWMLYPHDYFDPAKCHALYNRYLGEMELADSLGYDGVCVNEHHQTPHSLMPAPNVMAGAVSARIKNGKILILGRALPLVDNPLAVAEEWAMLDNLTAGRIITGMVRGIGIEYHASGVNPGESVGRYYEAHDLIKQAWTRPGPFRFDGKYYQYAYVNPFPRPFQSPHPPIWIPSGGNPDTIVWAAAPDRKYTYVQFFNAPYESVKKTLLSYRDAAESHGYDAKPDQLAWAVPTYVADTDEQAINQARPHIEALFNDFMAFSKELLLPPGYTNLAAAIAISKATPVGGRGGGRTTIEDLLEKGIVHIGSAATVRARLEKARGEIGLGHVLALLQFGTLPADLTRRNIELYASDVVQPLRAKYPD